MAYSGAELPDGPIRELAEKYTTVGLRDILRDKGSLTTSVKSDLAIRLAQMAAEDAKPESPSECFLFGTSTETASHPLYAEYCKLSRAELQQMYRDNRVAPWGYKDEMAMRFIEKEVRTGQAFRC